MELIKIVKSRKGYRRKYEFYRGLGYSDQASAVLSVLTYGDSRTAFLVRKLGEENFLTKAYQWFLNQDGDSPEDAVIRYECKAKERRSNYSLRHFRGLGALSAGPQYRYYDEDEGDYAEESPMMCFSLSESGVDADADFSDIRNIFSRDFFISEKLATDEYEPLEEKRAESVLTTPTSTFRMTTSNASIGVVFNQLRSGRSVSLEQVRIEELLNAFDYIHEPPTDAKFSIQTELRAKPSGKKLLYINVQAAEEMREHQNIVLLLDTSGSMCGNAEVTQETVAAIISKLRVGDVFSLVTYSTEDRTVVQGYPIQSETDREELLGMLMGVVIEGCTNGSAGIETAYEIGETYFRSDWSNQVILITDGDLNFGISDKGGLQRLIEKKKESGLFLSVIGTGLYNYKDDKLEVLSKCGNGTYCVVNTIEDVMDCIDRRYAALTNIVAKDVKAQVEFNPRFVKAYRLLGYENRRLNHQDFRDDTVISEPYGSGGHGVALYELEMRESGESIRSELKYQTAMLTGSDEICTIKVRYKEPLDDESQQIETVVRNEDISTENLELAYHLYCIAEALRGSKLVDSDDLAHLESLLRNGHSACAAHDVEKLELLEKAVRNEVWDKKDRNKNR